MGNAASIGRAMRADLSKTIGGAMLRARRALSEATPVDTHHAESNWVLSIGTPYTDVDGARDYVSFVAQQEGDLAMEAYDVGKSPKVFLRDNVLYVLFLDRGSSPQAEPGFVAATFNEAANGVAHGRRGATRKLLKNLSRSAYLKGY